MTLRELVDAYEGKQYDTWNHTASQMALLANVNRGKKGKVWTVGDFHPLMDRKTGTVINKKTIGVLKMFVPKHNQPRKGSVSV